jgi:hypothetical protein
MTEPVSDDIASIIACRDMLDAQPIPNLKGKNKMNLCFWRTDQYSSFTEAKKMGGLREIGGLETEYRSLYEVGGDLADTLGAISITADMMGGKGTIRFVLLDNDGTFLDAC